MKPILVFQTDFTYKEGAVASMYGVVKSVDRELEIVTATHEIPQYDTWSASYRLDQYMGFWPKGTIFVSVVDPGVGTSRKASVAKTKDGYYVVSPDNGSFTHVLYYHGIEEIRSIDESINRLKRADNGRVSIFHGRDLFAYCAARLASGIISYEEVGPTYELEEIVVHDIAKATISEDGISGIFEICDPNFGNLWTNIELDDFDKLFSYGDDIEVSIKHKDSEVYHDTIPYYSSFGMATEGSVMIYNNELNKIAMAIVKGNFLDNYNLGYGDSWCVTFRKVRK